MNPWGWWQHRPFNHCGRTAQGSIAKEIHFNNFQTILNRFLLLNDNSRSESTHTRVEIVPFGPRFQAKQGSYDL